MATFIVGAVVLAVVGLALYSVLRDRKRGGCPGCSNACHCDHCHQETKPNHL